MTKKLQVFISSTYNDLIKERQEVIEAILDAGHIPTGMELFKPIDKPQKTIIEQYLKDSDVYMLILGGRYGSIDEDTNISYTEWEYDLAKKLEIPGFSLVLTEDYIDESARNGTIKPTELETGNEKYKKFKKKVMKNLIHQIESLLSINGAVHKSLGKIQSEHPELKGWVRGDTVKNKKEITNSIHPKSDTPIKLEMDKPKIKNRINLNPLNTINQNPGNTKKNKIGFYRKDSYDYESVVGNNLRVVIPIIETIKMSEFNGILRQLGMKFKIQFRILEPDRIEINTNRNELTTTCLKGNANAFFSFYNKMTLSRFSLTRYNPEDCDVLTTQDLLILENNNNNIAILRVLEIKPKLTNNESDILKIEWKAFS